MHFNNAVFNVFHAQVTSVNMHTRTDSVLRAGLAIRSRAAPVRFLLWARPPTRGILRVGDKGALWKVEDCNDIGAASAATEQAVTAVKERMEAGDNSSTKSGMCRCALVVMLSSL